MSVVTYEHDARTSKAARLSALFYDHARAAIVDQDETERPAKEIPTQVIRMAHAAPPALWIEIARENGIKPPSQRTIEIATRFVIMRCQLDINDLGDPFRGFPTS